MTYQLHDIQDTPLSITLFNCVLEKLARIRKLSLFEGFLSFSSREEEIVLKRTLIRRPELFPNNTARKRFDSFLFRFY